ncbi:uncharacterized protein LOC124239806 isoform X2 [Equus quagga]|uniref:uncharacterized protein LOC124239806 isoform X2 n=1 Tax=Equus quagga TaxID=89248 RepID=UPI001EE2DED8|nr:uncharacterized protein LOC124239806 isoform X2 [Equus quagga]
MTRSITKSPRPCPQVHSDDLSGQWNDLNLRFQPLFCQCLPGSHLFLAPCCCDHCRRNRKHQDKAASCAGENCQKPWVPVRVLHPWHRHEHVHTAPEPARAHHGGDRGCPAREPVPLHRLQTHPPGLPDLRQGLRRESQPLMIFTDL